MLTTYGRSSGFCVDPIEKKQLNHFLPRLVYFLLLLLFAKTGADALGLVAISNALGSLFAYLPNLIAALLLVVIGTTAGQFAGRTVTQAARESGIEFAAMLGRVVSALIATTKTIRVKGTPSFK